MKYKEQFVPFLSAAFRITLFTICGVLILLFLIPYIFSDLEFLYLLFLIPVAWVVLFGLGALVLSEILRLQLWNGKETLHNYSRKELLSLYSRSFIVVTCGIVLAILFWNTRTNAFREYPGYIFLFFDLFLTLYAISSIIKGERLRELNIRHIQSENALLKGQLNPHFLYNTLNNIDALIAYDADKASETVLRLSSLLRYMTYQSNKKQVLLKDELNHLHEYISLQQLRLENPQAVLFNTNIQDEAQKIAPMLLMPFIENIFKHATDKIHDGVIKIRIETIENQLILHTENRIDKIETEHNNLKNREGGVGLKVVKRRLELLYPHRHQLQIHRTDCLFCTILTLNLK